MSDIIQRTCAVLQEAAETFRKYAKHHRAKLEEGEMRETRAARNDEMANKCETAFAELQKERR